MTSDAALASMMYRRIVETFLSVAGIEEASTWAKLCASGICQATLSCAVGDHVTGASRRHWPPAGSFWSVPEAARATPRRVACRIGASIGCPYERRIGRRHWRPAQGHIGKSSVGGLFAKFASVVDALLCAAEGAARDDRPRAGSARRVAHQVSHRHPVNEPKSAVYRGRRDHRHPGDGQSDRADATVVSQPDAGQQRSQGSDENPDLESG